MTHCMQSQGRVPGRTLIVLIKAILLIFIAKNTLMELAAGIEQVLTESGID